MKLHKPYIRRKYLWLLLVYVIFRVLFAGGALGTSSIPLWGELAFFLGYVLVLIAATQDDIKRQKAIDMIVARVKERGQING